MLLNNKINKTKYKQQSLFEQCNGYYCMCNFPRYSVDKEGRGDKGRKRQRERQKIDEPFFNFQLFRPLLQFFKTIEGVGVI